MRRWLIPLSVLVLVLIAIAVALEVSRSVPPRPPSGPESIFEAETELRADPAATLDTLRRLGVDRVRVYVPWGSIAPAAGSRRPPKAFDATKPAAYPARNWTIYDTITRDAAARGIALDFTVGGGAPLWATGPGAPGPGTRPQWEPSARAFAAFVRAVATRYSGWYVPRGFSRPLPRVDFWAIWNEPNYGPYLAPQAIDHSSVEVSPALYRKLLDVAWNALYSTGHGHDTILIGELAPRGLTFGDNPGAFSGMVPLRFIRALYCVDASYQQLRGTAAVARGCPADVAGSGGFARVHPALFHASGFAVHPYPQGQAPDVPTPDEPDYADLPAMPRLEHALDQVQTAYGSSTRFPIYSTEYGYQTNPPEPYAALSPAKAAYYLNWGEYITWHDRRARSFMQYLLVDPPGANFATGLEFKDGTPKPTYDAYRLPLYLPITSTSRGGALEVWGCVRPAHFAKLDTGRAQRVQIQFQRQSDRPFLTVQTVEIANSRGYFDVSHTFPASGSVRLTWTYPDGQVVHSRPQRITVG